MPKKKKPAQPWTVQEIAVLKRSFATSTNTDLAARLGRTVNSVDNAAHKLSLKKSAEHRSQQSRRSALAAGKTSAEMAALGSLGGKIGGKARAEALTPARRKKIASAGGKAKAQKKTSISGGQSALSLSGWRDLT